MKTLAIVAVVSVALVALAVFETRRIWLEITGAKIV